MSSHGLFTNFGARRFPKDERKALWCARRRIPLAPAGPDAPTTARKVGLLPRGGQYFLSKRKKVPKKASGTATPEAAHVAARRGLRPAGAPSGLPSSTGCLASHSSLPVALLASHPPCGSLWAAPKAPRGPRFPSGQFAALTRREKALDCPFWRRGSKCRAQWSWIAFTNSWSALVLAFFRRQSGRAFFPPLPIAALLRRRLGGDEGQIARVGMLPRCPADFAAQKADGVSKSCWPVVRAGGPVAQRRSVQANWQEIAPDPRAVAPVVPRR